MAVQRTPAKKTYFVEFPNSKLASKHLPLNAIAGENANYCTDTRRVVDLGPSDVAKLKRLPGVDIVPNYPITIPPGEQLIQQPIFSTAPVPSGYLHGAEKLHALGFKGKSSAQAPIGCVIDTGIFPHKDLGGRIIAFYDVPSKSETPPKDGHGHGTFCAGEMAADGGVFGAAPASDLIGIKVLDDNGSGTLASVVAGVEQAGAYYEKFCKDADRPMIVNMSLGGRAGLTKDDPLHKAIAKVLEACPNMVICIAAGNSGPSANTIGTPGNMIHPRCITVAAADTRKTPDMGDDGAANFSGRGGPDVAKGQNALRENGMMADGVDVFGIVQDNKTGKMSGTSMAAPHTAGGMEELCDVRGALLEKGKAAKVPTMEDLKRVLRETSLDHPNIPADTEGFGEIDVYAAAQKLVAEFGKEGVTLENLLS